MPIKINMHPSKGFTIVELLIVIVVIAVLAAITIVAFNGVQVKAQNTSRLNDMQSWQKILMAYKSSNGSWPSAMTVGQTYCLGKGFPIGYGGEARCRDYQFQHGGSNYSYLESDNSTVMNQLASVAVVPSSTKTPVKGDGTSHAVVGPYVTVNSDGTLTITNIFKGSTGECPKSTTEQYVSSAIRILWCEVRFS